MKKVIDISIGGINFTMEDDAYFLLKEYLTRFEETMTNGIEAKEVMEDVEARVAEIFQKEMKYPQQVIDEKIVNIVIIHLGKIEDDSFSSHSTSTNYYEEKGNKHFYRNPDDKKIAGVCSGIAAYFNIDVTLVRIIFVVALLGYLSTLWIYVIIWIVTKEAFTIPQKLEMRGIPVTAENIRKFTQRK